MNEGITVTPKTTTATPDANFVADDIGPIAGLLGLDRTTISPQDTSALEEIYKFVRGDAKEMTELELLYKVRTLENRLGIPSLGERRLDKLARYVKLQSQIDNLTKARDGELR